MKLSTIVLLGENKVGNPSPDSLAGVPGESQASRGLWLGTPNSIIFYTNQFLQFHRKAIFFKNALERNWDTYWDASGILLGYLWDASGISLGYFWVPRVSVSVNVNVVWGLWPVTLAGANTLFGVPTKKLCVVQITCFIRDEAL